MAHGNELVRTWYVRQSDLYRESTPDKTRIHFT